MLLNQKYVLYTISTKPIEYIPECTYTALWLFNIYSLDIYWFVNIINHQHCMYNTVQNQFTQGKHFFLQIRNFPKNTKNGFPSIIGSIFDFKDIINQSSNNITDLRIFVFCFQVRVYILDLLPRSSIKLSRFTLELYFFLKNTSTRASFNCSFPAGSDKGA